MNTHIALVECSYPPALDLIANGSREFCLTSLTRWTESHPTPQYSRALVVEITDEVICEPGVGIYSVPVLDQGGDTR